MQPIDTLTRSTIKSGSFGIRTPLRGLKRFNVLAFFIALLALAAAAGVWFFMPLPPYTASVMFQISAPPDNPSDLDPSYYKKQTILVKSDPVLTRADEYEKQKIEHAGRGAEAKARAEMKEYNTEVGGAEAGRARRGATAKERIEWLRNKIGIDTEWQPEFMHLTLKGDDEEEIMRIVQAVADAYVHESNERDKRVLDAKKKKLKDAQIVYESKLSYLRAKLSVLTQSDANNPGTRETNSNNAVVRTKFIQKQVEMAERELLQTESEIRRVQVELANLS